MTVRLQFTFRNGRNNKCYRKHCYIWRTATGSTAEECLRKAERTVDLTIYRFNRIHYVERAKCEIFRTTPELREVAQ